MNKSILFILIFAVIMISCKKTVAPDTTNAVDLGARDDLYTFMNDYYLWYKVMPTVVKDNYKDPYELLDAMMYKTLDRWSFVMTYDEFIAQYTGTFVGHGIRIGLDHSSQTRIVQIYNKADLYKHGVRRGWIVKTLNGTALAPIFIAGNATAYNNLIGPSQAGWSNTFVFQTPEGKDSSITTSKSTFTLNTVLAMDTLHLGSGITGHLVFDEFFTPANTELDSAFTYFRNCNITNLIVDLRYNGGGDMSILTNMASYLVGSGHQNATFLLLSYNDKHTDRNTSYIFNSAITPVNVSKIVFITSRYTASASEDLINGLTPFFNASGTNLVTLGDTTNGKPVGMLGKQYGTYYYFFPITFNVVNSALHGDFFSGISPGKYVPDDVTHDFSDRNETCYKEALYYLEHGTFSSKSAYLTGRSVQFSEKAEKLNNAFVIERGRK